MKPIVVIVFATFLAACGSDSTAPRDVFAGTWTGAVNGGTEGELDFTIIATDSGGTITGTGTALAGAEAIPFTFTGRVTTPTITLSLVVDNNTSDPLPYVGRFATADSIVGTISEDTLSFPLSLKKQ